jgi:hypothetical protein
MTTKSSFLLTALCHAMPTKQEMMHAPVDLTTKIKAALPTFRKQMEPSILASLVQRGIHMGKDFLTTDKMSTTTKVGIVALVLSPAIVPGVGKAAILGTPLLLASLVGIVLFLFKTIQSVGVDDLVRSIVGKNGTNLTSCLSEIAETLKSVKTEQKRPTKAIEQEIAPVTTSVVPFNTESRAFERIMVIGNHILDSVASKTVEEKEAERAEQKMQAKREQILKREKARARQRQFITMASL